MTHHSLLSLWWFSHRVFFSNCVDCWKHTTTKLVLTKPPWHRFPSWLTEGKSPSKILRFEMHRAYHWARQWLPLGPLLLYKIYPFLPSSLGLRTIILKKWNYMKRYTFNFVFLVATTSSNANFRHFLEKQQVNVSDFTEIARNRFWNWRH